MKLMSFDNDPCCAVKVLIHYQIVAIGQNFDSLPDCCDDVANYDALISKQMNFEMSKKSIHRF